MQAFAKEFNLLGFSKDPDYDLPYNSDSNLQPTWDCINMNTNEPCLKTDSTPVVFNQSESSQYFRARSLSAYNSYFFTYMVTNTVGGAVYNFTAILIILEMDIPPLIATYANEIA